MDFELHMASLEMDSSVQEDLVWSGYSVQHCLLELLFYRMGELSQERVQFIFVCKSVGVGSHRLTTRGEKIHCEGGVRSVDGRRGST